MKVAVAVYGIPRGGAIAFSSLVEKVISPLSERIDVKLKMFAHFFLQARVVNVRSGENGPLDFSDYGRFYDSFNVAVEQSDACLKTWSFDVLQGYGDAWSDDFSSLANLVRSLHSLRKVCGMVEEWAPDAVIFCRPDLEFHDRLSLEDVHSVKGRPLGCYVPAWQWWEGYNDRFAICGSSIYRCYGRRIELSLEFCEQGGMPLHSEKLLRYALSRAQASVRITRMRASRVRVNSVVKTENFGALATLGAVSRRHFWQLVACVLLSTLGVLKQAARRAAKWGK